MAAAKMKERLAVNKQRSHTFHMDRFNLKKLNEEESKENYRLEVSKRFAALENMGTEVEIISARDTIRKNIKISAKESLRSYKLKMHKIEERCSKY
jgi:hypothetical protein